METVLIFWENKNKQGLTRDFPACVGQVRDRIKQKSHTSLVQVPVKKMFRWFILIFTILATGLARAEEERINLAVAEFEGKNVSAADASVISDFLRTDLVKMDVFNVLEREKMAFILAEQQFQMSGCTDRECVVDMGRLLNVEKVISGNLTKLEDIYYITASVIDIESGKIVVSERAECPKAEEIVKKVEELARAIATRLVQKEIPSRFRLPGERPSILKVMEDGKKVIINRGSLDGVKEKDIFQVANNVGKKIGRIIIVSVDEKEAEGKIVKEKQKIEQGFTISPQGRRRVNTIGVMGGMTPQYIEELYNILPDQSNVSGGIYCEYVFPSSLGIQIMGMYNQALKEKQFYDWYYDAFYRPMEDTIELYYPLSFLLKYHFAYDSSVSPYLGIGSGLHYYKWGIRPTFERDYLKTNQGYELGLVLDGGIDFFTTQLIRFSFDCRYFISRNFVGEYHTFNKNIVALFLGVSLNW